MTDKESKRKVARRNILGNTIRSVRVKFQALGDLISKKEEKRQSFLHQVRKLIKPLTEESDNPTLTQKQSLDCLIVISSFLDIYELSQLSLVCRSFNKAAQSAILTRPSFTNSEYSLMLDLHKGVCENLLFLIVTSCGVDTEYKVKGYLGEYNIFTYACYKGYFKCVINLLHKCKATNDCLLYACINHQYQIFKTLLEDSTHKNSLNPAFDSNICLRICATEGYDNILEYLLGYKNENTDQYDVDPNDLEGYALKMAIKYKRYNIIYLLVRDKRVTIDTETLNKIILMVT